MRFCFILTGSHLPFLFFALGFITAVIVTVILLISLFNKQELNNFEGSKLTKIQQMLKLIDADTIDKLLKQELDIDMKYLVSLYHDPEQL